MTAVVPILEGAPNFRDMGGIVCDRGRLLRERRLLRSGALPPLRPDEYRRLAAYDVRLICDLRNPDERAESPSAWPASHTRRTLTADSATGGDAVRPTAWRALLRDPAFDTQAARARMLDGYRRMPRLYAGLLSHLFNFLAVGDDGAALVHCTAGKDRTGFVCAMTLHALGASREAIEADYLESRSRVAIDDGLRARLDAPTGSLLPDHAEGAMSVLAGVDLVYLNAAFDEIEQHHRSIDGYLIDAAGLSAALRERLQARLLTAQSTPAHT